MPRQSITFTSPNDEWLKAQVDSEEYGSKSDVVNDLIRQARREHEEREAIRAKLIRAENSGMSSRSPARIREETKARLASDV
jgi:antitoxin ParD1/3/4